MPESCTHMNLVSSLVSWIAMNRFQGQRGCLLIDAPDSVRNAKPPTISGYVPDVFGASVSGDWVAIGEAKTAGDIENVHTKRQLAAFLQYCSERPGSVLVLAVPWHMTRYVRVLAAIIARMPGCGGVPTVVLEQLPG
jgi:hypothetical protein